MKRRGLLFGASAALAVAAGAGVAVFRSRRDQDAESAAPLWALRLARPQGGELRPETLRGRPLLVNFWATWCPPCVAELPLLDRFARDHAGWHVIGLAVDQLPAVRDFLGRHVVSYGVGMAGLDGLDLARRFGNAGGGLPFSVVLTSGGQVAARKLGAIDAADLEAWARSVT